MFKYRCTDTILSVTMDTRHHYTVKGKKYFTEYKTVQISNSRKIR